MSVDRVIHIVDDDDAVRDSAALLLEIAGYSVLTYGSGVDFLEAVSAAPAGCVLLDIHMPRMTGLEVQRVLRDRGVAWPVIVLTGQGDIGIAVQAMKGGAFEFLEKPYQNSVLLGAITEAFERLETVIEEGARAASAQALVATLTPRELQIMRGLLGGLPNKLIAHELDLSVRTVEVYRATVMDKLGARSLSTAVRIAMAAGVQPLGEGEA